MSHKAATKYEEHVLVKAGTSKAREQKAAVARSLDEFEGKEGPAKTAWLRAGSKPVQMPLPSDHQDMFDKVQRHSNELVMDAHVRSDVERRC